MPVVPVSVRPANVRPANVRIVLCHPSDPRNVGSCIRAVANFGLGGLRLVGGEGFDAAALDAFASGSLPHVHLERFATVAEALHDAAFTLGTSRRHHEEDGPQRWPLADLAPRLGERASVCVLFGHERNGLSRAELDFCDAVVSIPTSPDFPSMNLSHAVACFGYELSRPDTREWADPAPRAEGPAKAPGTLDRDAVFREIAAACAEAGFPPGRSPTSFARRLRRLLTRADATPAEMSLLAGVFRELKRLSASASRPTEPRT